MFRLIVWAGLLLLFVCRKIDFFFFNCCCPLCVFGFEPQHSLGAGIVVLQDVHVCVFFLSALCFSSFRSCLWLWAVGSGPCWLRVHCFHVWDCSLLGRPCSLQNDASSFTEGLVSPSSPAGHIFSNCFPSAFSRPIHPPHLYSLHGETPCQPLPHSHSHPPSLSLSLSLAGTFKLLIEFSEEYPNKPPTVRFVSRMFHPNGKQTQWPSSEWWPGFPAELRH